MYRSINSRISYLTALAEELERLGVPSNYYSLGANRDERTCLLERDGKWLVYYSERGRMEDLREFSTLGDAAAFLVGALTA